MLNYESLYVSDATTSCGALRVDMQWCQESH